MDSTALERIVPGPDGSMNDASTWQGALLAETERLGRWIQGRAASEAAPSDEVVEAERYLDPEYLRGAIARAGAAHAADDGEPDIDLRLAASRFTRHYAATLSITALVALANGVGVDVSPGRCRIVIRHELPWILIIDRPNGGVVRCAERATVWPAAGPTVPSVAELRERAWSSLYAGHLVPLFERILELGRVSPNLSWTNAAEYVGMVSDSADEYLGPSAARAYVEDRHALLGADRLPGLPGANPLGGRLEWVPSDAPDLPNGVQLRRVCCITYLLADRLGRLCQNCPFLPLEDRVALIRERHGVPTGTPGGPAERRAIEVGLQKLRTLPNPPGTE